MKSLPPVQEQIPIENIPPTRLRLYQKQPFSTCKTLIEWFSTNNRKRHPSSVNKNKYNTSSRTNTSINSSTSTTEEKTTHLRLITIGPSHYCEKARWALDLVESDPKSPYYYTEDCHPPLFAGIATLEASNGEASMTPMVVYKNTSNNSNSNDNDRDKNKNKKENEIIYDSSNIIKHFCPQLYPSSKKDEIIKMETYLGSHLGATSRVILYQYLLQKPYYSLLTNIATVHSSSIEKFLWGKLVDKGLNHGLRTVMNVNEDTAKGSLDTLRQVFQDISNKLRIDDTTTNDAYSASTGIIKSNKARKREYIMDTDDERVGFTAVDLTFAALAAPLIAPPEIAPFMETRDHVLPKELVDLKYELRATLAGKHVLEMYRKHRLSHEAGVASTLIKQPTNDRKINRIVEPKVVGRNKLPSRIIFAVGAATGAVFYKKRGTDLFHSKL